ASNGPLALSEVGEFVEAHTSNGPISFKGSSGEVHLTANNGPISVDLSGDVWNGSKLDAHTDNGPVSLRFPDNFRSGVRVETSGHSPVSCGAAACQAAYTQS